MSQRDATNGYIATMCVCVFLLFEQHAVQTATFQTNGLRSLRMYVHNA